MPRPTRLSLDMMETLIAVIEAGGDAMAAAAELDINQPSMSKRLAFLQHANPLVRFPWLEKHGKTWKLTAEGERNYPAIRQIVRLSHTLQQDYDARVAALPDVSLACGQLAAQTFVREALGHFRKQKPNLRIHLATPRGRDRIIGVANGVYDLAVVTHGDADIHCIAQRPLYVETLFTEPWVIICGAKAPKAIRERFDAVSGRRIDLKQIAALPVILPEADAGLRAIIERATVTHRLPDKLEPVLQVGGWPTVLQYVREGFGVGLVTKTVTIGQAGLLEPKPVDERELPPTSVRLIARHHIGETVPDWTVDVHAFAQCLREAAHQLLQSGM